ncbi:MAG: hypothetical protein ACE361_21385 [Aureliella sp.]
MVDPSKLLRAFAWYGLRYSARNAMAYDLPQAVTVKSRFKPLSG